MTFQKEGFPPVIRSGKSSRTATILAALRTAGVTEIRFRFSGGNDESFVDGFEPKENVDLTTIKVTLPDLGGQKKETALSEAVETYLHDWLGGSYDFRPGYGNGVWTMADGTILSEHQDEGFDEYNGESNCYNLYDN